MMQQLNTVGNGVMQIMHMQQAAVGRQVGVLKPYQNPAWVRAQVVGVDQRGITISYGGTMLEPLTPQSPNLIVRLMQT